MSFEKILVHEFTSYYALNTSLSIALQFSTERSTETVKALRRLQAAEHDELKEYINQFCKDLPLEILNNPFFAYRVRLVPKIVGPDKAADFTIETVNIDNLTFEEKQDLEKYLVGIRLKQANDPGENYPHRHTELLKILKLRLPTKITTHDLVCLNKVYKTKENASFYFKGKVQGSPPQYSDVYIKWIIQKFEEDSQFFIKTRALAKNNK